ncbi:MAG: prepilin peptidase, partial [Gemmataceae bacterium]
RMGILAFWIIFVFLLGVSVGSYLNVCVARLPYEKCLLWPGSRCGSCYQAIPWYDNIPILGYLRLRGRCRSCGQSFSPRYLFIELGTGLLFVLLFFLEMVSNVLELPTLNQWDGPQGLIYAPRETLVFFHHAILVSFLLAASICDLMEMEIPLAITLWGTFIGLVLACLMPWPFPESAMASGLNAPYPYPPTRGAYAWPLWYPLPSWLPAGSWQLGLATGVAGSLAGMILIRLVRFLFTFGYGKEGLGLGDADLMMMAGAFLGWQAVVIAFFLAVFPGLFFAMWQLIFRGENALPFGPSLSLGVCLTFLGWSWIGPSTQMAFFEPFLVGGIALVGSVALVIVSFSLSLLRYLAG